MAYFYYAPLAWNQNGVAISSVIIERVIGNLVRRKRECPRTFLD